MFEPERALRVATILTLMSNPPGERRKPKESDLAGIFDIWFDGGAVRHDGGTQYVSIPGWFDGCHGDGPEVFCADPVARRYICGGEGQRQDKPPGLALLDFGAP